MEHPAWEKNPTNEAQERKKVIKNGCIEMLSNDNICFNIQHLVEKLASFIGGGENPLFILD